MALWSTKEHLHKEYMVAGVDPRTGGYIDDDYLRDLEKTSPDLFKDKPDPTGGKQWKPKPGTDPLTGLPLDLVKGREPDKEDAPYRPQKPGGPPWPGYPNPMPPGAPPTKLASNTSESEEDLINPPIELAGNPYGLSPEEIFRRKTLQDIINDPNTDPQTLREAQKQWLLLPPIEKASLEMNQVYKKDATKYGPSDSRIKGAGGDKDKLLDAARPHPDKA